MMKQVFAFAAVAVVLAGLTVPASSLPLGVEGEIMGRWKRQDPNFWKCSYTVTGCNITFCCEAMPVLLLDTLTCHLDGRAIDCESNDKSELPVPQSLCFSIDANLATVNNGGNHRMVINVRGRVGESNYGLPWYFTFRVDPFYCSSDTQPPTPNPGTVTTEVITETTERTTETPVTTEGTTETPVTTERTTETPVTTEGTTETPVTTEGTTETPVTTEGTTMTTAPTEVTTVVTTMTPPTTQPTTRPTTQPTTRPTSEEPTTRPTTQPTTRPTTQPTTQPTTEEPTTRPTTEEPTTRPTTEEPTTRPTTEEPTTPTEASTTVPTPTPSPSTRPPTATCNIGRNSDGDLVILCETEGVISGIACELNRQDVNCTYDGGMVTIDDDLFIEGRNVIELIITYANNQSYVVVMTYEMERSTPAPPTARVECTARFSPQSGMEITCIINSDFTGNGITAIHYNINDQGREEADDIPTFVIDINKFRNGRNRILIDITHSVYGTATLPMDFDLNIPTAPPPPPPPPCQVSCSYRGVVGAVEFVCSLVEGNGRLNSVGYSVNGNSGSNLPASFQIPTNYLVNGMNNVALTFAITCNGEAQTIPHLVSIRVQLAPPPTLGISNIRATSTSAVSNVRISYSIRGDLLTFSVSIGGEVVSGYDYTLNGGPTVSIEGTECPLDGDSLNEGPNTLQLTVKYRNGASQANFTITFNAQK